MYHSQNRLTNRVLAIVLSLAMTAPLVITDNFATKSKSVKAAETTTVTYGDVNSDGKLDILDLISLKSYVTENNSKGFFVKAADLDSDGIVSKDVVIISETYYILKIHTYSGYKDSQTGNMIVVRQII